MADFQYNTRRVYVWFIGAPEDRPGGPWWYHDFKCTREGYSELLSFIQAMRPFAYAMVQVDGPVVAEHDPMDVKPCIGEQVTWVVKPPEGEPAA